MNAAHYIISRMRSCKNHADRDILSSNQMDGCFSSVGSATFNYHGDDAVGYGPGYMVVADGVSGTLKASGVLAQLLVNETLASLAKMKRKAMGEPIKASTFREAMESATKSARRWTKWKGRLDSTISAAYFDEGSRKIFVYTIGDCKCIVIRKGVVVFESDSIIYDFNVPAVVSSNQTVNYAVGVQPQVFSYEAGDVCLLFSDGVHDNLYVDEVLKCVDICAEDAGEIAKNTVEVAQQTFTQCHDYIPFAVSAAGFCREALEEMKANKSLHPKDFESFSLHCTALPSEDQHRPIFGKEKRVRQLAFYSASNLLAFAQKKMGKKDDITVCAAILE